MSLSLSRACAMNLSCCEIHYDRNYAKIHFAKLAFYGNKTVICKKTLKVQNCDLTNLRQFCRRVACSMLIYFPQIVAKFHGLFETLSLHKPCRQGGGGHEKTLSSVLPIKF